MSYRANTKISEEKISEDAENNIVIAIAGSNKTFNCVCGLMLRGHTSSLLFVSDRYRSDAQRERLRARLLFLPTQLLPSTQSCTHELR